jgi:hypothetical protein
MSPRPVFGGLRDAALEKIETEIFQHFAGKNPVVPMQNARARFDNEASHI